MNPDGAGSARTAILTELHGLRASIADIQGSVLATTDGLVLVHDLGDAETFGVEPEGVAALAAVNLGLSQRIADTASHGDLVQTVIRGTFGQVITCAVSDRALMSVLVRRPDEVAGLGQAITAVGDRIAPLVLDLWQDDAAHWRAPA